MHQIYYNKTYKEIMKIPAGDLDVLLPGSADWKIFREGM